MAASDVERDVGEGGAPASGVAEANAVEPDRPLERKRRDGWLGGRHRQAQQLHHVAGDRPVRLQIGPAAVGGLEQWQHPQPAERDAADQHQGAAARSQRGGQSGEQQDGAGLDDEARRGGDDAGAGLGAGQALVGAAELGQQGVFAMVDDEVADGAEAFLHDADALVIGGPKPGGVGGEPAPRQPGDAEIKYRQRREGEQRRGRIDADQQAEDGDAGGEGGHALDPLVKQVEGDRLDLFERGDHGAAVMADMICVGLGEDAALDLDRQFVGDAGDGALAQPEIEEADAIGGDRAGAEGESGKGHIPGRRPEPVAQRRRQSRAAAARQRRQEQHRRSDEQQVRRRIGEG